MNLTCQAPFDNQEQCSPVVANLGLLCYPAAAIKSLRFALLESILFCFIYFTVGSTEAERVANDMLIDQVMDFYVAFAMMCVYNENYVSEW